MKEIILPVTCNQLKWIALIGFPIMMLLGLMYNDKSFILANPIFTFGMSLTAIIWFCQLYEWFDNKWTIKCKCDKK